MDWHVETVDLNENLTPQSCGVKTNRKKVNQMELLIENICPEPVDRESFIRNTRSVVERKGLVMYNRKEGYYNGIIFEVVEQVHHERGVVINSFDMNGVPCVLRLREATVEEILNVKAKLKAQGEGAYVPIEPAISLDNIESQEVTRQERQTK
ncbi:hypothetical protein E4T85_00095 [Bacillus stratosphericus]|uniref:hypothetical protein n=1 Tax=Bacillus aerius TaxID=293388 RepID=UPI001072484A|nr:hypothetical protein [Bacillus aerius]MDH6598417.1 hypothetical protein [Bacillus aerius]TFV12247.1 hypothetical protein E4T85_00095 [Bacillus stratosphericus]